MGNAKDSKPVKLWIETMDMVEKLMRADSRNPTSPAQFIHWVIQDFRMCMGGEVVPADGKSAETAVDSAA